MKTVPEQLQLTNEEKQQIHTYKAAGWSDWRISKALKQAHIR